MVNLKVSHIAMVNCSGVLKSPELTSTDVISDEMVGVDLLASNEDENRNTKVSILEIEKGCPDKEVSMESKKQRLHEVELSEKVQEQLPKKYQNKMVEAGEEGIEEGNTVCAGSPIKIMADAQKGCFKKKRVSDDEVCFISSGAERVHDLMGDNIQFAEGGEDTFEERQGKRVQIMEGALRMQSGQVRCTLSSTKERPEETYGGDVEKLKVSHVELNGCSGSLKSLELITDDLISGEMVATEMLASKEDETSNPKENMVEVVNRSLDKDEPMVIDKQKIPEV
jgi:hypothetical protein